MHPESLRGFVIGCPGRGREQDELRPLPHPAVLPSHPSNLKDWIEWPPGGQAGSATQGSWEEASWQTHPPPLGEVGRAGLGGI